MPGPIGVDRFIDDALVNVIDALWSLGVRRVGQSIVEQIFRHFFGQRRSAFPNLDSSLYGETRSGFTPAVLDPMFAWIVALARHG